MKANSPLFSLTIAVSLLSLYSANGVFADSAKSVTVEDKVLPEEKKEFVNAFPGNDAINFAAAYGDRSDRAHGTFGRFPANFETPVHTHTNDYRAIVLKGEMTNPFEGETNAEVLKPGSFWQVKAGSVHTTACVSDIPCEFYMYSDHAFDFVPSE